MLIASLSVLLCISSILFEDDFNDGNADGWFTVGAADYIVVDNKYHFMSGTEANIATSYRGETGETMSTADYCLAADIEPELGIYHGLTVRYSEGAQLNLMLVLAPGEQSLQILRVTPQSIIPLAEYEMPIQTENTYRLKFQCNETTFSGKAWAIEEPEPEDWCVSFDYPPITDNGSAGLFTFAVLVNRPSTVIMSSYFDNVVVEEPYPYSLSQSTWALIKATF